MFDRVADCYDAANRKLSLGLDRRWRRAAVRRLGPRPGGRYLDVGTGTGELALEILRQAPGARVTAIDPAERMLAIAREKARRAGVEIDFRAGDALRPPPAEGGGYDGIILGFVYRNLPDRRGAATAFLRALRPGGRLVVLDAARPERWWTRAGFAVYAAALPLLGRFYGDAEAYRYLAESVQAFSAEAAEAEIRAAGFTEVKSRRMALGAVWLSEGVRP